MKKLLGLIGAAVCAVAVSTSAQARDDVQFYVGGDYQYVSPSYKSPFDKVLPSSLSSGADAHVGIRWLGYYAAELGYMQSNGNRDIYGPPVSGVKGPLLAQTETTISGPTLDLLGYLPFGNSGVAGFATVGGSYLTGKAKVNIISSGITNSHDSELGYRAGLGVEWRPQPRFGVRVMVRYQSADFSGIANHAIVGSVGFNFYL